MKVDFIPETEPKLSAADLNGLITKQFSILMEIMAKRLMEVLSTKTQTFPLKPYEDSDEDSDEDSE